jgi:ESS family glutamate:Na+ symporter
LDNATFDNNWSRTVAEEAESLGLLAACVASILLLSGKPLLFSCGWLDCGASSRDATAFHYGAGQAEAFERSVKRPISKSLSSSNVNLIQGGADLHDHSKYFGDKEDNAKTGHASLGAHISLIALTVFLSFGVGLFSRLIEMEFGIDNNILSGVRMFKLAMCCALFSMQFILSRTRLRFRRDWFMRLCGLMLDLLIISALSTSYPRPKALESTHYVTCGTFVVLCILWNMFCLVYIAPKVFPNFWFSRALTLTSDALGHSYTGLLFARTFDPNMESPVPAAYAYKLMLFFIPSPGVKNSIIVSIVSIHGPGWAFVICLCIVVAWYLIYDTHFRERFVPAVRKKSKSSLINSRHSSVDHSVDDPLINVLSFDHHDVDGGEDECLDESGHNSVGDQDANPTLGTMTFITALLSFVVEDYQLKTDGIDLPRNQSCRMIMIIL